MLKAKIVDIETQREYNLTDMLNGYSGTVHIGRARSDKREGQGNEIVVGLNEDGTEIQDENLEKKIMYVSRRKHASVYVTQDKGWLNGVCIKDGVLIKDEGSIGTGSKNGTRLIRGSLVINLNPTVPCPLRDGDRIFLGEGINNEAYELKYQETDEYDKKL